MKQDVLSLAKSVKADKIHSKETLNHAGLLHLASGMNSKELADLVGKELIFHGGLDTQKVLPFGTSEEVYQESNRLMDIFSGCGHIFAPGQVLNKDIPAQNMAAMYNAINFIGNMV